MTTPQIVKKERKKTDNPGEGWEDGTPPPHRDFKERGVRQQSKALEHLRLGVQTAVINLTSRAGELRSAPSGPDDRDRVAGKRALAPGVRVRRERALK